MNILVDSNILIRLTNAADPQHLLAADAADKLELGGNNLCIVPQNVYEFWSVATRPIANKGLGLSVVEVQSEVARFQRLFIFFEDRPAIFTTWENLVALHAIIGKNAHDARLVAAMAVHGITHLLTFNQQDFQRFTNITVLTPADVMAMP